MIAVSDLKLALETEMTFEKFAEKVSTSKETRDRFNRWQEYQRLAAETLWNLCFDKDATPWRYDKENAFPEVNVNTLIHSNLRIKLDYSPNVGRTRAIYKVQEHALYINPFTELPENDSGYPTFSWRKKEPKFSVLFMDELIRTLSHIQFHLTGMDVALRHVSSSPLLFTKEERELRAHKVLKLHAPQGGGKFLSYIEFNDRGWGSIPKDYAKDMAEDPIKVILITIANSKELEGVKLAIESLGIDIRTFRFPDGKSLLEFATESNNTPLAKALVTLDKDLSIDVSVLRNVFLHENTELLQTFLNLLSGKVSKQMLQKALINEHGSLIFSPKDYHASLLKILLEQDLHDFMIEQIIRLDRRPYYEEYVKFLVRLFQSVGVDFKKPMVIDWLLEDSPKTPYSSELPTAKWRVLFEHDETAAYILQQIPHDDIVLKAVMLDNYRLMNRLKELGVKLNVEKAIRFGLNHGHDRSLAIILNSGQVPGLITPDKGKEPIDGPKIDSDYYVDFSVFHWNLEVLEPYLEPFKDGCVGLLPSRERHYVHAIGDGDFRSIDISQSIRNHVLALMLQRERQFQEKQCELRNGPFQAEQPKEKAQQSLPIAPLKPAPEKQLPDVEASHIPSAPSASSASSKSSGVFFSWIQQPLQSFKRQADVYVTSALHGLGKRLHDVLEECPTYFPNINSPVLHDFHPPGPLDVEYVPKGNSALPNTSVITSLPPLPPITSTPCLK